MTERGSGVIRDRLMTTPEILLARRACVSLMPVDRLVQERNYHINPLCSASSLREAEKQQSSPTSERKTDAELKEVSGRATDKYS